MKSLDANFHDNDVESAYVITLKGNKTSEELTARCVESLQSVGQKFTLWQGFDGVNGRPEIPEHLKGIPHLLWPKLVTERLSWAQVACFMSHYSLWCRCLTVDKPIVILEHDAIMVKPYLMHRLFNSIVYLGSIEQTRGQPVYATPPHASDQRGRLRSLCRAHAYAIDPAVARSLVSYTIKHGIYESLDMYVRAELFPMSQFDVYAYDLRGETTVRGLDDCQQSKYLP
jgi:hypothetical protein